MTPFRITEWLIREDYDVSIKVSIKQTKKKTELFVLLLESRFDMIVIFKTNNTCSSFFNYWFLLFRMVFYKIR